MDRDITLKEIYENLISLGVSGDLVLDSWNQSKEMTKQSYLILSNKEPRTPEEIRLEGFRKSLEKKKKPFIYLKDDYVIFSLNGTEYRFKAEDVEEVLDGGYDEDDEED